MLHKKRERVIVAYQGVWKTAGALSELLRVHGDVLLLRRSQPSRSPEQINKRAGQNSLTHTGLRLQASIIPLHPLRSAKHPAVSCSDGCTWHAQRGASHSQVGEQQRGHGYVPWENDVELHNQTAALFWIVSAS